MRFRVVTGDGTVFILDEADVDLITAYLMLGGYPPVSVEAMDTSSPLPETNSAH